MTAVKHIFWNPGEHRLRGLLRLAVQILIFIIVASILSFLLSAILYFSNRITGTASLAGLVTRNATVLNVLLTLAAFVLSIWLAGKWLDHRKWSSFGLHFSAGWMKQFLFGLALGAVLMTGIFLVELAFGWISISGFFGGQGFSGSFFQALFGSLVVYLSVGIYEELYFRGYLLRNLAESLKLSIFGERASLIAAWLISSILFGLAHSANPNASIMSTFNIILAGMFLALGFILTGELAISIGLHITWNFFEGFVFGFPVSGFATPSPIIQISQGGPSLLTGGSFGPEAGWIGNAAVLIGCGLIIFWLSRQGHAPQLKDDLAAYHSPETPIPQQDE